MLVCSAPQTPRQAANRRPGLPWPVSFVRPVKVPESFSRGASELISRPTEDLDLFTHAPVESVTPARDTFFRALSRRDWEVAFLIDTPTFCRMQIADRDREVLVDLAIDSPPSAAPTMTILARHSRPWIWQAASCSRCSAALRPATSRTYM